MEIKDNTTFLIDLIDANSVDLEYWKKMSVIFSQQNQEVILYTNSKKLLNEIENSGVKVNECERFGISTIIDTFPILKSNFFAIFTKTERINVLSLLGNIGFITSDAVNLMGKTVDINGNWKLLRKNMSRKPFFIFPIELLKWYSIIWPNFSNPDLDLDILFFKLALLRNYDLNTITRKNIIITNTSQIDKSKLYEMMSNTRDIINNLIYVKYKLNIFDPGLYEDRIAYYLGIGKKLNVSNKWKFKAYLNELNNLSSQRINLLSDNPGTKDISFVTDKNQIDYALINTFAILDQTKLDVKIHILLCDMDDDTYNSTVETSNKIFGNKVEIYRFDSSILGMDSKLEHVTIAANSRMYLHKILSGIESVLYLDNDTFVDGDISEVLNFFDTDKHYGRRWEASHGWIHHLRMTKLIENSRYINSGVMHLNLSELRKNNFENKIKYVYDQFAKELRYVDQDILNLSIEFNDMPQSFNFARSSWSRTYPWFDCEYNTKIYHFLSVDKQWISNFGEKKREVGDLTVDEINLMRKPRDKWLKYSEKFKKLL